MGTIFRRRIPLAKGVTMNLGKTGVSFTAGVRGMGITAGPGKDTRAHIGLPGTGLSFNHNFSAEERRKERSQAKQQRENQQAQARRMREAQRRDRERAAREAMQARQNQLQAWKDEVGQYNEYVEGITSFHKIPVHLEEAEKEFAERLQSRTFEKKSFDKTMESLPEFSWNTEEYPAKRGKKRFLALTTNEEIETFLESRLKRCGKLNGACNFFMSVLLLFAIGYGISCYIADDGFLWSVGKALVVFFLLGIPVSLLLDKTKEYAFVQAEIDKRKEYKNSIMAIVTRLECTITNLIDQFGDEKEEIRSRIARSIESKLANSTQVIEKRFGILQEIKLRLIDDLEKQLAEDEKQFSANEVLRLDLLNKAADRDINAAAALCEALLPLDIDIAAPEWIDVSILKEYSVGYSIVSLNEVSVLIELPDIDVIPECSAVLSPTGISISYPELSRKARMALYDQFIASFSLFHAQLLLLTYPYFEKITVESRIKVVDPATGQKVPRTVLYGGLERKQCVHYHFPQTDPVEALISLGGVFASPGGKTWLEPVLSEDAIVWAAMDDGLPEGLLPFA